MGNFHIPLQPWRKLLVHALLGCEQAEAERRRKEEEEMRGIVVFVVLTCKSNLLIKFSIAKSAPAA